MVLCGAQLLPLEHGLQVVLVVVGEVPLALPVLVVRLYQLLLLATLAGSVGHRAGVDCNGNGFNGRESAANSAIDCGTYLD